MVYICNSRMSSYIVYINNAAIKLPIYFNSHMRITGKNINGRKLIKIGTGITNGTKNGFVPPVNLRSESANII